jgi:hypothetical protein
MTAFTPADDRVHALECSLSRLAGISEALTLLGRCLGKPESEAFGYLAEQLYDERENARDAFTKLFYDDKHRPERAEADKAASPLPAKGVGSTDTLTAAKGVAVPSAAPETLWRLVCDMEEDVKAIRDFADILQVVAIAAAEEESNDAAGISRISECIRNHADAVETRRVSLLRLL